LNELTSAIELDEHDGPYSPGETISGQYVVEDLQAHEVKAAELSVLWYTVGQGDEDLAVHYFARQSADESLDSASQPADHDSPRRFRVVLPKSPLSYDGVLVKIRWCVRLRAFLARGREVVAEKSFQLGAVPPANIVTP
jgi:hypothetical protein